MIYPRLPRSVGPAYTPHTRAYRSLYSICLYVAYSYWWRFEKIERLFIFRSPNTSNSLSVWVLACAFRNIYYNMSRESYSRVANWTTKSVRKENKKIEKILQHWYARNIYRVIGVPGINTVVFYFNFSCSRQDIHIHTRRHIHDRRLPHESLAGLVFFFPRNIKT